MTARGLAGWKPDAEWQRKSDAARHERGWPPDVPMPRCMRRGPLAALVGREPCGAGDLRWHIAIQHQDRAPTWNELVDAAHALRPGIVFVIGVPPRSWWMDAHPRLLHLWELRDASLTAQWTAERQGHPVTSGAR